MEMILNDRNFDEAVSSGVSLVDFWAAWCAPCKRLAPILEDIAKEYDGRLKVCKVNVDENPALAQKFGIQSIPALFIFKDGELGETLIGFRLKVQIEEYIKKYV